MRYIVMFLLILFNLVLQSTLFQYVEILNIKPNTSILLIVSYAILRGDVEGSLFGFVIGLMQDMFFGKYIGLYALLGAVTGFLCGLPFKNFFRENLFMPLTLTAISTVFYEFAFYVTNFLFRGKLDFQYYAAKIIVPELVYNIFLSFIVYSLLYAINRKIEDFEKARHRIF